MRFIRVQRAVVGLLALCFWLLGGSGGPARAGLLHIPAQDEIAVGREAAARFEGGVRLMGGPELARIRRIGARIVAVCGRRDLPFTFKLVDAPDVNAITFPGGFVYVYRGLMDLNLTDDELAGVLGHEVTHAVKSHAFKRMLPVYLLHRVEQRLTGREEENAVTNVLETLTTRGLGREFEYEADRIGVHYAAAAGYDPAGLLHVLRILARLEGSHPRLLERLLATHPPARDRIRRLRPIVARLKARRR